MATEEELKETDEMEAEVEDELDAAEEEDKKKVNEVKQVSALEEAKKLNESLTSKIKELRGLVERQESLAGEALLRGQSNATQEGQKPKEESATEYKERIMAGAGYGEE